MSKAFLICLILICGIRVLLSFKSSQWEGRTIRISATVTSEPREYENSILVSLNNVRIFLPKSSNVSYGSYVVVEGIYSGDSLKKPKIILVKDPTSILSKARSKVLTSIRQTLPEPESSLLAGIVLGAPNIPTDFNDLLLKTGTSHIVVASGGNLAIMAMFLERELSKYLKRQVFLPIIAIILAIYSLLTGFGAPIVRALIMWLIIMMAQMKGRIVSGRYALFLTILLMLIYKPFWIKDVSFLLSVGATGGVMLFTDVIYKKIKLRVADIFKESLSTSIAAQIGILPISVLVFKNLNFLSPIWNTLVLWVVPYLTIIGLVGSVMTLVFPTIGKIVFFLCYPFAWYFTKVLSFTN